MRVGLPAGISYVPGSTSGATTLDPNITGQVLIWAGPFGVSPSSSLAMDLSVRVADVAGDYVNEAGADAGPHTVARSAGSRAITVVAAPGGVAPPVTPTAVAGVERMQAVANALGPIVSRRIDDRPLPASRTAGTLPATGSGPQDLLMLATLLLASGGSLLTAASRRQGDR